MIATRIVLADDHPIVRQGLRALLEDEPDFQVVGEASSGREALEAIALHRPGVLISDLKMPEMDGIELTRQVRKRFPTVRTILLSMYDSDGHVAGALRNGAWGFVRKDASVDRLVESVRTVLRGARYLSPPYSELEISAYLESVASKALEPYDALTPREREVLVLAAEGSTNARIAQALSISPRTVEVHRARMMHKLGLRNQAELVRYALQERLI